MMSKEEMLNEIKEKAGSGLLSKVSPDEIAKRDAEKKKRMEELRKIAEAYEKMEKK